MQLACSWLKFKMSDFQNTAPFSRESVRESVRVNIFWFAIKEVKVNAKYSGHRTKNIPQKNGKI